VFLCLAPFRFFSMREKLFISWVGLRGAVGIFLASIPLLVGLPKAHVYFDVGFIVVLFSLLIQGWTISAAARALRIAMPRPDVIAKRTELDLPGQLEQEIVGYPVNAGSPYLRRGITPSWAKLTLVVRDQRVHTPEEAGSIREGDHVYFLAPPGRVQALDRFFVDQPAATLPEPETIEDFFVPGDATLGALAEIYGVTVPPEKAPMTLSDYFTEQFMRTPKEHDALRLGPMALVAHTVADGKVTTVGLQLAEPEREPRTPVQKAWTRLRAVMRYLRVRLSP
jgi:cell volume regulation protein A